MTVEDWLVLTNRADIDEKEMVGLQRDYYGKNIYPQFLDAITVTPVSGSVIASPSLLTDRCHTGETVKLVQQELPNWWSSTGRVEAG